jgi:hypothetical protein
VCDGTSGASNVRTSPLARAEQQHHALRVEPPRHELQRVGGPLVEPVRVVDEAQDRPVLGELGQQRETGGVDEEALLAGAVGQAERRLERGGLRRRQPVEVAQRRPQQLVQRGERQLGLGFHPARGQHVHVARALRASSSSTVLPTPASPRRASTPLRESRAAASRAPMRARSASLPNSTIRP